MSKKDWETDGTRNGNPIYCPVYAYGTCPYYNKQYGTCHIADSIEDCEDFAMFWGSWDKWANVNDIDSDAPESFIEDEIKWAGDVYGYEDTIEDNEE